MNKKNKILLVLSIVFIFASVGGFLIGRRDNFVPLRNDSQDRTSHTEGLQTEEDVVVSKETKKNNTIISRQPALVTAIQKTPQGWILELDFLTQNPNFIPGETDFFLNQNKKVRTFQLYADTKTYKCSPDTSPSTLISTDIFMGEMKKYYFEFQENYERYLRGEFDYVVERAYPTYYFDISGNVITAVYEQCLP